MVNIKQENNNNLKSTYDAITGYHNDLVQLRFTIAGLVFAANGFIVSGFFQPKQTPLPNNFIPVLGLVLAVIFWLLDIRINQLLNNIGLRGLIIEVQMGINQSVGFFSLMKDQPIMPNIPFTNKRIPRTEFFKSLFSHSLLLKLLYVGFILFWVYMLFPFKQIF